MIGCPREAYEMARFVHRSANSPSCTVGFEGQGARMEIDLPPREREIFNSALSCLNAAGIPFVVAGAFCVHFYTGIWRFTKDMDVFALPESVPQALDALAAAGFKTWIEAEHWLGKATKEDCLVDVIFGSGNWLSPVDAVWLARSRPALLLC